MGCLAVWSVAVCVTIAERKKNAKMRTSTAILRRYSLEDYYCMQTREKRDTLTCPRCSLVGGGA